MAVLGDEVVVAGDHQEIVIGVLLVEHRQDGQPFPFLHQVVGVVGQTVVQAEFGELGRVVDVQELLVGGRGDGEVQHAIGRNRVGGQIVGGVGDVGGGRYVDQIHAAIDRLRGGKAVARA